MDRALQPCVRREDSGAIDMQAIDGGWEDPVEVLDDSDLVVEVVIAKEAAPAAPAAPPPAVASAPPPAVSADIPTDPPPRTWGRSGLAPIGIAAACGIAVAVVFVAARSGETASAPPDAPAAATPILVGPPEAVTVPATRPAPRPAPPMASARPRPPSTRPAHSAPPPAPPKPSASSPARPRGVRSADGAGKKR